MKIGDVVLVRQIKDRRNRADGKLASEMVYQAPKGALFALVLIGTQKDGDPDIDANEVLRSMGWKLDLPGATP